MNDGESDHPAPRGPLDSAEFVLMNLLEAGNLDRVVAEARRFLERDPEDTDAHYYLTLALIDLGRRPEAREHLGVLISREPEEVRTHIAAVCHYGSIESWRNVRNHLAEGLRLAPDLAFFHRYAAIADLRELKFDLAKRHIARARELDPDDADIANLYIRIHGATETSVDDALKRLAEYEAALRLDPHNAALHDSIGDLYLDELDDPAAAEAHYREALRIEPGDRDYQRDLFHAVAKRSIVYRLFSIPSRTFTWLGHLGYAIVHQPWRIILFLIAFKLVIAFFVWLAVATALFWPGGKVYEWLLVSEIKRGSAASIGELRAWFWFRRWPMWARFLLFLAVSLAIWGGLFWLLGVSMTAGYIFVAVVTGIHLFLVTLLWGVKRIQTASAKRREKRRKTPPPLPKRSGSQTARQDSHLTG